MSRRGTDRNGDGGLIEMTVSSAADNFQAFGNVDAVHPVSHVDTRNANIALDESNKVSRQKYAVGVVLIIVVVVMWVGSSELQQYMYNDDFEKPFFVTFYNTASFMTYFIVVALRKNSRDALKCAVLDGFESCRRRSTGGYRPLAPSRIIRADARDQSIATDDGDDHAALIAGESVNESASGVIHEKLSVGETMRVSLVFCVLWFAANYAFDVALSMTSVASSTIISSTSGFFTLALETAFIKRAQPNHILSSQIVAIAMSIAGVALVAYSDQVKAKQDSGDTKHPDTILGDLIALLGAFLYGCYLVFLKRRIGDEDAVDLPLFFGFVGLFNVLVLWPGFLILNASGFEIFVFPSARLWGFLTLNALLGTVASDYLWLLSSLLTSPIAATLGLSLTIPLSLGADVLLGHVTVTWMYYVGMLLVLAAFVMLNLSSYYEFNAADAAVRFVRSQCGRLS